MLCWLSVKSRAAASLKGLPALHLCDKNDRAGDADSRRIWQHNTNKVAQRAPKMGVVVVVTITLRCLWK